MSVLVFLHLEMSRHSTFPTKVKSRTKYVFMVASYPFMWKSKLQSETALSTMEGEIIDLAHSCFKLFPIMDGVSIMGKAIGLPIGNTTIQILIHENNAESLVLAKTLPPQFTSRSKHYHMKTIWF